MNKKASAASIYSKFHCICVRPGVRCGAGESAPGVGHWRLLDMDSCALSDVRLAHELTTNDKVEYSKFCEFRLGDDSAMVSLPPFKLFSRDQGALGVFDDLCLSCDGLCVQVGLAAGAGRGCETVGPGPEFKDAIQLDLVADFEVSNAGHGEDVVGREEIFAGEELGDNILGRLLLEEGECVFGCCWLLPRYSLKKRCRAHVGRKLFVSIRRGEQKKAQTASGKLPSSFPSAISTRGLRLGVLLLLGAHLCDNPLKKDVGPWIPAYEDQQIL